MAYILRKIFFTTLLVLVIFIPTLIGVWVVVGDKEFCSGTSIANYEKFLVYAQGEDGIIYGCFLGEEECWFAVGERRFPLQTSIAAEESWLYLQDGHGRICRCNCTKRQKVWEVLGEKVFPVRTKIVVFFGHLYAFPEDDVFWVCDNVSDDNRFEFNWRAITRELIPEGVQEKLSDYLFIYEPVDKKIYIWTG